MIYKKKSPSIIIVIVGAVFAAYAGYLVNGAWTTGININDFINKLNQILAQPFHNYYKGYTTVKAVLSALLIYAVALTMYYTSKRNMMPGKEHGTAQFADISKVNNRLRDKNEHRNRILSQNVRMSLNTRMTKLNNNILIIGGSGAGKTFYEVKPNLMQMPDDCSFILTDPKGGAKRSIVKSYGTIATNN